MTFHDPYNTIRPLIRPIDVAKTLGVSISTVRRLTADGRLPVVQISDRRLGYRPADVDRLIAGTPPDDATDRSPSRPPRKPDVSTTTASR